jgi:hypothetical protein
MHNAVGSNVRSSPDNLNHQDVDLLFDPIFALSEDAVDKDPLT